MKRVTKMEGEGGKRGKSCKGSRVVRTAKMTRIRLRVIPLSLIRRA